jgi:hypothetical protein
MEQGTFIQHLESTMICEENSTDANDNQVILNVYPMMKGEKKKMEKLTKNASKSKEKECQYYKKSIKKRCDFETRIIQKTN